jgi:hypothetical protein
MTDTSPGDRLAMLMALEDLAELERERERWRLLSLARLDRAEQAARATIADPGPLVRSGQVVRDSEGEPVPNEAVRRRAEKSLRQIRRDWARLTGEAPPGESL